MIESARSSRPAAVIGFVGPSGVGKTSLLEALVPRLIARELRVGLVKHAHHGFLADRPGKDSYRFYEAGAAAVALVSSEQIATFTRNARDRAAPGHDVSLVSALETLPSGLDLVLAEGFSWEPIPHFVLCPEMESDTDAREGAGERIGLIRVPATPAGERPHYSSEMLDALVERLLPLLESGSVTTMRRGGGASLSSRTADESAA